MVIFTIQISNVPQQKCKGYNMYFLPLEISIKTKTKYIV